MRVANIGILVSGPKVALVRDSTGMTQEAFAPLIGYTKGGLANLETQDVIGMNKTKFLNLANLMKISPIELLKKIGADGALVDEMQVAAAKKKQTETSNPER